MVFFRYLNFMAFFRIKTADLVLTSCFTGFECFTSSSIKSKNFFFQENLHCRHSFVYKLGAVSSHGTLISIDPYYNSTVNLQKIAQLILEDSPSCLPLNENLYFNKSWINPMSEIQNWCKNDSLIIFNFFYLFRNEA